MRIIENKDKIELALTLVIVLLIGVEIVLSLVAIREANQQMQVLQQIGDSAKQQGKVLNSMMRQQENTLKTIQRMNETLRRQLSMIAADQRRRLNELAKKPQLSLTVGGEPLSSPSGRGIKTRELTQTKAVLEAILINSGDATAQLGTVRVMVEDPNVRLSCDCPSSNLHLPTGVSGQTLLARFDRLTAKTWLPLPLTVEYPAGSHKFQICFNADAENFPRADLGCLELTPPN